MLVDFWMTTTRIVCFLAFEHGTGAGAGRLEAPWPQHERPSPKSGYKGC